MKNGKLVTAYLDACAEMLQAQLEALNERLMTGWPSNLWDACIADGWTIAELDAMYYRRFGFKEV